MKDSSTMRSGFVGIVGRSNVGKSTMLNYYIGEKTAIISSHPQTTRRRILGVLNRPDAQVLFLDSPGFQRPEHALGKYMFNMANTVIAESDLLVIVIDARSGLTPSDKDVFKRVKQAGCRSLVAINKIDAVKKPMLLPIIEQCTKLGIGEACIPVSAATGEQMDVLLTQIIERLPEGPRWYEKDTRTDQTNEELIREFIREPVLAATRQEVPHAVAVLIDKTEERSRATAIYATIMVEKEGQKAIIIGKGGSALKTVGQAARIQIEKLLKRKVYLELWVKVVGGWRSDPRRLRQLGYYG